MERGPSLRPEDMLVGNDGVDQKARGVIESRDSAVAHNIERGEGLSSSRVVLEFMRHGKKEKAPGKDDRDIRIVPEARVAATEKGKKLGAQAEVSVVYASPRNRTQESAGRVALGNQSEITADMSLEDIMVKTMEHNAILMPDQLERLRELLSHPMEELNAEEKKELKLLSSKGKKIMVDERLDFTDETEEGLKAFMAGRYLDHAVKDSDQLAIAKHDTKLSTYTRSAGKIAEIVSKYIQVGKNFNKRVSVDPEKYKKFGNQLERYFGSHQGVVECFLLKAIEKIKGVKERDEILALMPAGFKELQGVRIGIENNGKGEQVIVLDAEVEGRKINLELTPEILMGMVSDRDVLDEQCKSSVE